MESQRNFFGRQLEQLLLNTNVKSATVAAELSYDVSYISKWITGKALPSRKNLEKVLGVIASVLTRQCSPAARRSLEDCFGVTGEEALREAVAGSLRDAYYQATGELNESQYANNASLRVMPRGAFPLLGDLAGSLDPEKGLDIVVLGDLFSLEPVYKLQLAGIDSRRFRLGGEKRAGLRLDYLVDFSRLDGGDVYDVILLIHMMTNFSQCGFRLFSSDAARGKLIIAAREEFAGITLLTPDSQFLCTTTVRERKAVEEVYDTVKNLIDPDRLVFLNTDMEQMLLSHEYLHNLLSQDNRWLVGHLTEQFVPETLFPQLLRQRFGENGEAAREAERAWILGRNVIHRSRVKLMLYQLALVDFVLTGELDFFNQRILLEPEQRREVLEHIRIQLKFMDPGQVKLVREGFSEDFKYITNPCLFLSDSASYLRLENRRYQDNLLLIKEEAAAAFAAFFETIWGYGREVLLDDHSQILQKLDSLIETVEII